MFKLNNKKLINPRSLISKFELEGRNTDLLRMANSQLFKYIDGVGEGAFLMYANDAPTGKLTTFETYDSLSLQDYSSGSGGEPDYSSEVVYTLLVKDKFVFNFQNTNPVILVYTQELKSILKEHIAKRNYNVIDQRSVEYDTVFITHPDRVPKQIDEIINDIFEEVAVTIDSPSTPIPYNFFVQGLNLIEIIDLYCKAYGLIWTVYFQEPVGSSSASEEPELTIHIFALSKIEPDAEMLSDMNFQYTPKPALMVYSVHPIIDCCLKSAQVYHHKDYTDGGQKTIPVFCPFYPALVNFGSTAPVSPFTTAPTISIANESELNNCSQFIQENFNHYSEFENHYFVNNFIKPFEPSSIPQHTEIRFAFNGQGYRTTFFSGRFQGIPIPLEKPFDREARNVIGEITFEYKKTGITSPPHFFVTPLFGLDGWIDEEKNLQVINLYNWDYGAEGAKVRVEWDCNNLRWIPVQQEYICPPSNIPPPLPEPSDEEPKISLDWEE